MGLRSKEFFGESQSGKLGWGCQAGNFAGMTFARPGPDGTNLEKSWHTKSFRIPGSGIIETVSFLEFFTGEIFPNRVNNPARYYIMPEYGNPLPHRTGKWVGGVWLSLICQTAKNFAELSVGLA